ncbi:hypothetical protein ACFL1R_03125 [Candidatus Latescibacterota bacterium]
MNRRKAIKVIPLTAVCMSKLIRKAHSTGESSYSADNSTEPLAIQYTKKVRERLTWIRENQAENLMEAAYAIARTFQNGGRCFQDSWDAGHSEADSWPGRNGEPEIFSFGYNMNEAGDGDLILTCSTLGNKEFIDHIKEKNIFVIAQPSSWSGDVQYPEFLRDEVRALTLRNHADIWIENQATSLGGLVYVPGMPAPIGPVSGVVGKTTIWMMLADVCRILARRGISVPVKGDEPKITEDIIKHKRSRGEAGWVNLNNPLMDNYFDVAMRQIELIGAELGTIRKIAKMAVDTKLDGGTIWGYSLHYSISGEADTRRSGLAITRKIEGASFDNNKREWVYANMDRFDKNFKGTSKDCVIMGITKPDDEIDLMFLDLFKKRGMKTASLGPMTRNIEVPQGRTVYKETDLHAGRMCDTYGLFAIPGFDQRICPTSGVLLDQLFWSTMMEVVEQYIERTGGDVPGVFYTAALKGGVEWMIRMNAMYKFDPLIK